MSAGFAMIGVVAVALGETVDDTSTAMFLVLLSDAIKDKIMAP